MTLGYSRKSVRLLVFESSTQIWAQLHEQAFRRIGGSVRVVVLDNLSEAVLQPDIYDPALNPLYRDMLAHYGAIAIPCRVADPDRKGKVESGVGHAKKTPLKGQRFESLEAAQSYLDHWEQKWADTRIHGTTKRQVAAMFAEEKPRFRHFLSNLFGITNTATAQFIWTAAWKSMQPITVRRRVGSAARCKCSGTCNGYGWSTRPTANCCASISEKAADATASIPMTGRSALLSAYCNCWFVPTRPASISALFRERSTANRGNRQCAAFRVCCRSARSTALCRLTRHVRWHWRWRSMISASCGATWSAICSPH